ncbi:MAG: hypothetical protein QGD94_08660, partial [Planctomycetia bacterium]|nr:hypothetical protein [Planctomycetia bacterium]
ALGQAPKSTAEGRVSPPKKARRPAPARRAQARADAPEVVVLVFKQIPAQSFVRTMEQLLRATDVLRSVKMAINEPANAVVILGPRDITAKLARAAKQLDVPNQFHENMRRREMRERKMHAEMKREEARAQRKTHPERRAPHRRPEHRRPEARRPTTGAIAMLMNPRVRKQLGLSEKQADRISRITRETLGRSRKLAGQFAEEMKRTEGPEKRAEIQKKFAARRKQVHARFQRAQQQILDTLTPEQRKKLGQAHEKMRRHIQQRPKHAAEAKQRKDRKHGDKKADSQRKGRKPGDKKAPKGAAEKRRPLRPGPALIRNPRVQRELRLSDKQAEKIRGVFKGAGRGGEKLQRLAQALKKAKDKEHRQKIRKQLAEARQARAKNLRRQIMQILQPKQREQFERIEVRAREQARKEAAKRRGDRAKSKDKKPDSR